MFTELVKWCCQTVLNRLRQHKIAYLFLVVWKKNVLISFQKRSDFFFRSSAAFPKGLWAFNPDLVFTTEAETEVLNEISGNNPDTRQLHLCFHTKNRIEKHPRKTWDFMEPYHKGNWINSVSIYLRGWTPYKKLYCLAKWQVPWQPR